MAGSTATIPVQYDQKVIPGGRHRDAGARAATPGKIGVRLAAVSLRRVLVFALWRRVPLPQPREFLTLRRSATAPRPTGSRATCPAPTRKRRDAAALRGVLRAGRVAVSRPPHFSLGLRYEFVTTPNELNGQVGGPAAASTISSRGRAASRRVRRSSTTRRSTSFAPRLGAAWTPGRRQHHDRARRVAALLPAADGVVLPRHDVPRLSVLRRRRHPPARRSSARAYIEVLAARRQSRLGAEAIRVHLLRRRAAVRQQWHVDVEHELPAASSPRSATSARSGHNLPFYGDPNAVPSEYSADGTKRSSPARRCAIRAGAASARAPTSPGRFTTGWCWAQPPLHRRPDAAGRRTPTATSRDTGRAASSATATSTTAPATPPTGTTRSPSSVRPTSTSATTSWSTASTGCPGAAGSPALPAALASDWNVGGVVQVAAGCPSRRTSASIARGDRQSDTGHAEAEGRRSDLVPRHRRDVVRPLVVHAAGRSASTATPERNSLRGPGLKVADLSVFKNVNFGRATARSGSRPSTSSTG